MPKTYKPSLRCYPPERQKAPNIIVRSELPCFPQCSTPALILFFFYPQKYKLKSPAYSFLSLNQYPICHIILANLPSDYLSDSSLSLHSGTGIIPANAHIWFAASFLDYYISTSIIPTLSTIMHINTQLIFMHLCPPCTHSILWFLSLFYFSLFILFILFPVWLTYTLILFCWCSHIACFSPSVPSSTTWWSPNDPTISQLTGVPMPS